MSEEMLPDFPIGSMVRILKRDWDDYTQHVGKIALVISAPFEGNYSSSGVKDIYTICLGEKVMYYNVIYLSLIEEVSDKA
jgi:hypothetical protein